MFFQKNLLYLCIAIKKKMETYFVVRDTFHPEEDLKRNWSSFAGGWDHEYAGMAASSEDEAASWDEKLGINRRQYRYHPAYEGYVVMHYEGLGAESLDVDNLNDALKLAAEYEDGLAISVEAGSGHFYAEDVVSFHRVRDGRYVFEIKC